MAFGSLGLDSQVVDNKLGFNCSTDLQAAITAAIAAGTADIIKKWLVKIDTSANRTVDLCADTNKPEGKIDDYIETSSGTHIVAVRLFGYSDVESSWHSGVPDYIVTEYRAGSSLALGQQLRTEGDDYRYVEGVNTLGIGKIIYLDSTNLKVGFLI